jgi:small-conductance mechanosensitive channel
MGETVIIPNSQLIKNRVTVLGRRGDERIPARRNVDFSVTYDTPPSRVIAAIVRRTCARRKSAMSRSGRR